MERKNCQNLQTQFSILCCELACFLIVYPYKEGNAHMDAELFEGLTEEQIAKVKACKGKEELLELAKKEGVELTDEQQQYVIEKVKKYCEGGI